MHDGKFSNTHTTNKKSKLWCCANSAIELVDTVKKETHKQMKKRIKQLPETTQQMVVEIFLQNRKKKKQNWEDTNQEVTEKSYRKWETELNKENQQRKVKIMVPYKEGRRDGNECTRYWTKGEMIKHLISRRHLYSKHRTLVIKRQNK